MTLTPSSPSISVAGEPPEEPRTDFGLDIGLVAAVGLAEDLVVAGRNRLAGRTGEAGHIAGWAERRIAEAVGHIAEAVDHIAEAVGRTLPAGVVEDPLTCGISRPWCRMMDQSLPVSA